MLENIDLTLELPKREYKQRLPALQGRLHQLQRACRQAQLGTLVVFEGWAAAGKGSTIHKLTERLEPRACSVHTIRAPRTIEQSLPWMWRFWRRIPNWGEIAVFDRSWYRRVIVERVEELIPEGDWRRAYDDVVRFERALADDRYQIVKFFLHIGKDEQANRLASLEENPRTYWRISPDDWHFHHKYEEYQLAAEEMLERTETEWGPWTIVEATDSRWARIKVFETLTRSLEDALERRHLELPEALPERHPQDSDDEEAD